MRRAAAALFLAWSLPAMAASISGVITDEASGGALAGMQVRAWSCTATYAAGGCKQWGIFITTTSGGGGAYTLSVDPGTYLVDVRPGPGITTEYTDRWYDAAPPQSSPYPGFLEVDADQVTVATAVSGINIAMKIGGGIDGLVFDPFGGLLPGMFVRAEDSAVPGIHHNDQSQADPHLGEYHFRNLLASPGPLTYQIVSYWQQGGLETGILQGLTVFSGADVGAPDIGTAFTNFATDAFNGLVSIPGFPGSAHGSQFTSNGTLIAPLNGGDVDGFCFNAAAGDRYRLSARAATIGGSGVVNPFVDPILRFTGPGTALFDDDGGGGLDSLIADTGELAASGQFCAQVSTWGDSSFNGTTQGSTGRFVFQATLLNRRPKITSLTVNGSAAPAPPAAITLAEGDTAAFTISFSDADSDPLTVTALLVDVNGTTVDAQTLSHTGSTANYSWTLPPGSAGNDPYTVTFAVSDSPTDGEASLAAPPVQVIIDAEAPPIQIAPDDGARLATDTPGLEIQDALDANLTGVQYEFELYDATGALMPQSGVQPRSGNDTVFTPAPLPENAMVSWRARTIAGGTHSAWTVFRHFLVDVTNEPPPVPVLVKPSDGDEVMTRQPGFAASIGADPEGDAVTLVFQLASDAAFAHLVEQSAPVPVTLANLTTPWTPAAQLAWSGAYFARVYAVDALGAQTDFSNVVSFSVRADALPASPPLQGAFAQSCHGGVLAAQPPSIALGNVQDPDGEAVSLQLQLFDFAADPSSATPLLDVTQPQAAGASTAMDVSTMKWTEDAHYRVRARAGDGTLFTQWNECDFTLDAVPDVDAGVAPDAGTTPPPDAGSGPPPDGSHRGGCSSGAASVLAVLGLLAFFRRRSVHV